MTMNNYRRSTVGGKTFYNFDDDNVEVMNDDCILSFTKRDREGKVSASFKIDKAILKALVLEGLILIQTKDEKE